MDELKPNETVYGCDWEDKELYEGDEVLCINGEYVLLDPMEVYEFLKKRYDVRIMGWED